MGFDTIDNKVDAGGEFGHLPNLKKCRISCGMITQPIASHSLQQLSIQCRDMLADTWPLQFGELPHLRLLHIECARHFQNLYPNRERSSRNCGMNNAEDLFAAQERTSWNCKVNISLISNLFSLLYIEHILQQLKQPHRLQKWSQRTSVYLLELLLANTSRIDEISQDLSQFNTLLSLHRTT